MTEPKLGKRLTAAAVMALRGDDIKKGAADIGTDHALLPVYLCQRGCPRVIASDINECPTKRARDTIERYGMSDRITAVCRDGLDNIESFSPGVIIICGMGGELIADILSRSDYPSVSGCRLVLQPMTMQAKLRRYLAENGFGIDDETVVFDDGKYYQLISASYTGERYTMTSDEYTLGRLNIGRAERAGDSISDTDRGWLTHLLDAAERRVDGRKGSKAQDTDAQADDITLIRRINDLLSHH